MAVNSARYGKVKGPGRRRFRGETPGSRIGLILTGGQEVAGPNPVSRAARLAKPPCDRGLGHVWWTDQNMRRWSNDHRLITTGTNPRALQGSDESRSEEFPDALVRSRRIQALNDVVQEGKESF